MKKGMIYPVSRITVKATAAGKSLEETIRKMIQNKEPIQATAKINYTDRKDGVLKQYDIRADKYDMALEATHKVYAEAFTARTLSDKGYTQNSEGVWGKVGDDGNFTPMTPPQGEA